MKKIPTTPGMMFEGDVCIGVNAESATCAAHAYAGPEGEAKSAHLTEDKAMTERKYKLVPVEPTEEMLLRGSTHLEGCGFPANERDAAGCHEAMLADAPDGNPWGWQPIVTAPKGRKILAAYKNELGNWRHIIAMYYFPGTFAAGEDDDSADEAGYALEGWFEETETHEYILRCNPTLWQELPPPPEDESIMPIPRPKK